MLTSKPDARQLRTLRIGRMGEKAMRLDEDLYNQPTEPQGQLQHLPPRTIPAQATKPIATATTAQPQTRRISRRALMMGGVGASVAGLGIGGIALGQYIQHGGLSNLFHGPIASSVQIGHLLRRAGFGASPNDLATYHSLGYSAAVDRL